MSDDATGHSYTPVPSVIDFSVSAYQTLDPSTGAPSVHLYWVRGSASEESNFAIEIADEIGLFRQVGIVDGNTEDFLFTGTAQHPLTLGSTYTFHVTAIAGDSSNPIPDDGANYAVASVTIGASVPAPMLLASATSVSQGGAVRLQWDAVPVGATNVFVEFTKNGVGKEVRAYSVTSTTSDGHPGVDFASDQSSTYVYPFTYALLNGRAAFYAQYPTGSFDNADCNVDGLVNGQDINSFVALLLGGGS